MVQSVKCSVALTVFMCLCRRETLSVSVPDPEPPTVGQRRYGETVTSVDEKT